MLTLNQTVEILKNFSFKHKGLGRSVSHDHFCYGEKTEVGLTGHDKHAFMNAILMSASKNGDMISRRFLIVISDLVKNGNANLNHVLSDTELICYDLLIYLKEVVKTFEIPGLRITQDSELTDFQEGGDNAEAGWFFEITITNHIGNYGCNIPVAAGDIFDGNYIYVGGNVPAGNFQVLIKDQDGNTLQTFNTSGQYVVTVLTGIQQVIGNQNTTIIQNIIS